MKNSIINRIFIALFAVSLALTFFVFNNNKRVEAGESVTYEYNSTTGWVSAIPTIVYPNDKILLDDAEREEGISLFIDDSLKTDIQDAKYTYTFSVECQFIKAEVEPDEVSLYFAKRFSVAYNTNGGTGTTPTNNNKYIIGNVIQLDDGTGLSKDNLYFAGWSTDSSSTEGNNGNYTLKKTDVPKTGDSITFYAIWEATPKYNNEVNISITPLTYGLKKDDIDISLSNSDLKVKETSLICTDSTGEYVVDKVEKNGWYQVNIVLEGKDVSYCFPMENEQGFYAGGIDLVNYDDHLYSYSDISIKSCQSYSLDTLTFATYISPTESENLYLIISFKVVGFSVEYDDNVSDEEITVPTDALNLYYKDSPVNVSTDIPTRFGYVFAGWNTDEYATTGLTFTDGKYTVTSDDVANGGITFYAIWKKVIVSEPSKATDYEVIVDDTLTNVTYKWYKKVQSDVDFTCSWGTDNHDGTYSSSTRKIQVIQFSPVDNTIDVNSLFVKYTLNSLEYTKQGSNDALSIGQITSFTISNVSVYKLEKSLLSSETSSKFGLTTLENTTYYCEVLIDGKVVAESKTISPKAISFDGNDETSGTDPNTIYQLEGRAITLPANPYTKTDYKFVGWNSDKSLTEKLDSYTAGSTDATLYAIWERVYGVTLYRNDGTSEKIKFYQDDNGIVTIDNYDARNPSRAGYLLKGWANSSSATSVTDNYCPASFTLSGADIELYAVWVKIIDTEPSKDNNYKVTVNSEIINDSTKSVDYQWYKTKSITDMALNDFISDYSSNIYYLYSNYYIIYFYGTDVNNTTISFDCSYDIHDQISGSVVSHVGTKYVMKSSNTGSFCFKFKENGELSNLTINTVFLTPISGATSDTLPEISENIDYYCEVAVSDHLSQPPLKTYARTNLLTPKEITFDGNGAESGSVSPIYQLEGRKITFPECVYKLTNWTSIGWNNDLAAGVALSEYTVGSSNTLYSIWKMDPKFDLRDGNHLVFADENFNYNPTKDGYTFGGWSLYQDSVGATQSNLYISKGSNNTYDASDFEVEKEYYAIWLNDSGKVVMFDDYPTSVIFLNGGSVDASLAGWTWDFDTKTLTLDGLTYVYANSELNIALFGDGYFDAKLVINGTNYIGSEISFADMNYETYSQPGTCIFAGFNFKNINVTGSGSLVMYEFSYGISAVDSITFEDTFTGSITIYDKGGSAPTPPYVCAIKAGNDITINGGTFNLYNDTTYAINAGGKFTVGGGDIAIHSNNQALSASGDVTIPENYKTSANDSFDGSGNKITLVNTDNVITGYEDAKYVRIGITYPVVYHANTTDSVTNMPESNVDYYFIGDTVTFDSTIPERDKYVFVGWALSPTGRKVSSASMKLDGLDVYAVWEPYHECHDLVFDKVLDSSFTGGTLTTGNYFLIEDVTLTSDIRIGNVDVGIDQDVNICLNGHILNMNGDHKIDAYGSIAIYDCDDETEHKFTINGNFATLDENGSYIVKGGLITGFHSETNNGIITYVINEKGNTHSIVSDQVITLKGITVIGNYSNIKSEITGDYTTYGLFSGKCFDVSDFNFIYNHVEKDINVNGIAVSNGNVFCSMFGNLSKFSNVNFKNNDLLFNNKYSSKSIYVYGGIINCGDLLLTNVDISNNKFEASNLLNGLVYSVKKLTATNLKINDNTVKCDEMEAGLIYSAQGANIKDLTVSNNTITVTSSKDSYGGVLHNHSNSLSISKDTNGSIISNNTFNYSGSIYGGLIFNDGDSNTDSAIEYLDIKDNTINANCKETNGNEISGTLILDKTGSCTLSNCDIIDNEITINNFCVVYGLIRAKTLNINDVNIKENIISYDTTISVFTEERSANKNSVYGGVISVSKVINLDNVDISSNNISVKNACSLKGGIINISMCDVDSTFNKFDVYNNSFVFTSVKKNDDFYSENTNVTGLIYSEFNDSNPRFSSTQRTSLFKNSKFYSNTLDTDCDYIYGSFISHDLEFENVSVYDITATFTGTKESNLVKTTGVYVFDHFITLKGKTIISNNKAFGVESNLVLSNVGYESFETTYVKLGDTLSSDSNIGITYLGINDSRKFIAVENGKDLFEGGIFKVDSPRYYLNVVDEDIYINGRIIEQPSKVNDYVFSVNDTKYDDDTHTLTYQWYRVLDTDLLLEGNTSNALDTSKLSIGSYVCVVTAKTGDKVDFTISSNVAVLIPNIIEQPSAGKNQYTFIVDDSNCKDNNVSISYQWVKKENVGNSLVLITEDNSTILTKEEINSLISKEITFTGVCDTETGLPVWTFPAGEGFGIKFDLKAGDIFFMNANAGELCDYYNFRLYFDGNNVASSASCIAYTVEETGTYCLVAEGYDIKDSHKNDEVYFVAGFFKYIDTPTDDMMTLYTEKNISSLGEYAEYVDPVVATDKGCKIKDNGAIIEFNLKAKEVVYLKALGNTFINLSVFLDDFEESLFDCLRKDVIYISDEDRTVYFYITLIDYDEEPTSGEIEIYTITDTILSEINGQTAANIQGDVKGTYLCVATYSDGVDTISITSNEVYYDPYFITYDNNGGTGTTPTDDYKYSLNDVANIKSSSLTKEGCVFKGWSLNSDGTGTIYKTTVTVTGNITLYAVWAPAHTCDDKSYNFELDSTFTGGKLSSGNYFLSSDLYITKTITFDENAVVNICMNGHAIDCIFDNSFNVYDNMFTLFELGNGVSLTISNCNDYQEHSFSYDDSKKDERMVADYNSEGTHKYTGGIITGVFGNAIKFKGTTKDTTISLTLKGITFIGNNAGIKGLINNEYPVSYKTLVSISDCCFTHNGMIAAAARPGNDLYSLLNFGAENKQYGVDIKDTSFEYNYVYTIGNFKGLVGLYSDESTDGNKVVFDNVDFENNYIATNSSSSHLYGSLIYINKVTTANYDEEDKAIKLVYCDFVNNSVIANGDYSDIKGLIYSAAFLKVSDCVFKDNTLSADQHDGSRVNGGMFHQTNNLILENTIITNNTVNTAGSRTSESFTGLVVAFPSSHCYALVINDLTVKNNTVNSKPSNLSQYGNNFGYYIYSGYNLSISGLSFENNKIEIDSKVIGTNEYKSNSFDGAFIYTNSSYATYGESKLINDEIKITNSIFKSNSFRSISSGDMYAYLHGGILFFNHAAYLEDVDFVSNNINTEANINGGLIYSDAKLTIKGKETNDGGNISYVNSLFDKNTITNTNSKNQATGGLISAKGITSIDHVDFTENNITINTFQSLYGALIACASDDENRVINITNSLIKDNEVTASTYYGLVTGHFNVSDTDFISNHITATDIYGGILSSYWVLFSGNDSQGVYSIKNVNVKDNEFISRSNATIGKVFGLILNTRSPKITIKDLNIDGNTTSDTSKYNSIYGGVICCNNSNYPNYIITSNNIFDVSVTNNNIEATSIYGGFLFSNSHSFKVKGVTFSSNTFACENLYGGFADTAVDLYTDLVIMSNTYNVSKQNYANYFYCLSSSTLNEKQSMPTGARLYLSGTIAISNNEFTKTFADISCWEDYMGDSFVKGITIVDTSYETITPMTYFTDMEIITSKELCTDDNAPDVYAANIISLYEDKYYIDLVDDKDALRKTIRIFNRFIEQPTESNGYEYKLNEKDTEISYKWYSVLKSDEVDLKVYENKNDLSKYLYGTFRCIGTTTQGFKFVSQIVTITPTPVEVPSEDNGYKFIFNQELIEKYDVDVSYSWKTKADPTLSYITILDDSILGTASGEIEIFNYDGFYDETTQSWYASEGKAICVTNVTVKPGERIMVDVTTLDSDVPNKRVQCVLFTQEKGISNPISLDTMLEEASLFASDDKIFSFECMGQEEETYGLLILTMDSDEATVYRTNAVISKCTIESETTYVSDDDIKVYDDGSVTSYDPTTHIFTQGEDDDCAVFGLILTKDDIVTIEYLMSDYANVNRDASAMAYFYLENGFPNKLQEPDLNYYEQIMYKDAYGDDNFDFTTFKAPESGYYLFMIALSDKNTDTILFEGKVHVSQYPVYETVEGQTTNELSNVLDGEYLCSATFTSSVYGTVSVSSMFVDYITRSVTYNANGYDITVPSDTNTYKNTQKVTTKGTSSDYVVKNKNFLGWCKDADGEGAIYSIGDDVTMGKEALTLYAIFGDKDLIVIDENAQSYTYDADTQSFEIKGDITTEFTVMYYVSDNWTTDCPTNAGSYNVKITRLEDSDNQSYEKVIENGLVINKTQASINVDDVIKTYTYNGSEQTVESGAVANNTESQLVYSNNTFKVVGTYTITISSAETTNYTSASVNVDIIVNKATYDMSNAKWDYESQFTYNGEAHTVTVTGLPEGVTATYLGNSQTNAGDYSAVATLSYDSANYNEISIDPLSWKVDKAQASINVDNVVKTYTYNGSEQKVDSGAVANNTESQLVYSNNTFKTVNTYTVTISSAETTNYTSASVNVDITVNKATYDMTNVKWDYESQFTYNGEAHTVTVTGLPEGVTATYENNSYTNAGDYTATVTLSYDSENYNEISIDSLSFTINKAQASINVDNVVKVYTYNGSEQKVESGAVANNSESQLVYSNNTFKTVNTYTVTISSAETANYTSASVNVDIIVNKATYDMSNAKWDYESQFTYNGEAHTVTVTGLPEGVTATYLGNSQTNAGSYVAVATLSYDEANYNEISIDSLSWNINKATIDMSNVKWDYQAAFIEDGNKHSVKLVNLPNGVTATYTNNEFTEAGKYTASATLSYDVVNYNEISVSNLEWVIKQAEVTHEEENPETETKKIDVSVETEGGFDPDITVEVEVTVESQVLEQIEKNELTINYYEVIEEDEKVGIVFDVKLYRVTEQGKEEIPVSSLGENAKIKVKMLIPSDVDLTKLTRILHVHNDGTITEYVFDINDVDEEGYYTIEIDKLSEFAFIYRVDNTSFPFWAMIVIAVFILFFLLFIILFIFWKVEFDHTSVDNLSDRNMKGLDFIYRPINKLLFGGKNKD